MPSSTFSYTSADGTQLAAYRWDPAGEPRALRGAVQLTHGMGEHARRYEHVARALNEAEGSPGEIGEWLIRSGKCENS